MIDRDLLQLKVKRANTTYNAIAEELGMDRSTWYRQLREGSMSVATICELIRILHLTVDDVIQIFFAKIVASAQLGKEE